MANNINRRAFLALAAAGTAALALPPNASAAPPSLTAYEGQAEAWLKRMTLAEKVGQMTQAEQDALKDVQDIQTYALGSLLSGGNSDPKAGNGLTAWTEIYESYQKMAGTSRLGIPLLYGIDAVHGHNNVLGATLFPHNIALGCTRNPRLVEQAAHITAREMRATGIHWAFAPCVAVPRDARWGRTYEGFGETPELAITLGEAAVKGLQGRSLRDALSVLACAKHFIGDGGTLMGTGRFGQPANGQGLLDQGDTRLSEADLRRIHLPGYIAAIKAGVGSIMPSYSSWNGVKCSASKRLMTEILKQELGFQGFLISDYNALDQLDPDFKKAIGISINAGMDMVMVPQRYREFHAHLVALAQEGVVPMERIDDAVRRILRVKAAMGLLEKGRVLLADRKLQAQFGSAAHRAVARQCVRESLVLLKNEGRALPLSQKTQRLHVGGAAADDIGTQCGGWTISWQGQRGNVTTGGTTILQALKQAAPKVQITFAADGTGGAGADLGLVVIGEKPYAEGLGDSTTLALSEADVAAVNNMKQAGLRVVAVLLSGRPVIIGDVLDKCDAFLAAWLPGTEGQGVADVLFGRYKPTGKLSLTWPRTVAQLPLNPDNASSDPLFKYGYGLTY